MKRSSTRSRFGALTLLGSGLLAAVLLLAPLCAVPAAAGPAAHGDHGGVMAHPAHGSALSASVEHDGDCRPNSCCVAVAARTAKSDAGDAAATAAARVPALTGVELTGFVADSSPQAPDGWQPGFDPLRL